jgi:hypothetical protein
MEHTLATSATNPKPRRFSRFRLRWLLLLFVPLSISLAVYSRIQLQRQRIQNAFNTMNRIGLDANFATNDDCVIWSRNGNVTDSDLTALIPLGSGKARLANRRLIRLDLRGSKVSDEAIAEFRRYAPECELIK